MSAAKNRLAESSSPYLRQHAENPVEWYPWGPEALGRARAEDKPILLSVGYSACHWCHVMAHESFENEEIAQQMNATFINVKVDREERPDLDQLYQGVVQLLGRGGGWPLTVFLTPDLRPFFGGTYFPPHDKYGMPGFPKLLSALGEAWRDKRAQVEQQAEAFRQGLSSLTTDGLSTPPADFKPHDIAAAAGKLASGIDREHGGFGGAPKFPNPMSLALLLRANRRSPNSELLSGAMLSLAKMARGGVYDQLGGGFHRYSVDARWLVPHFEKMLYDNAQLLHLYTQAHQVTPSPLWKRVVEETVGYLAREMTAPSGAFFAAQDADSEGEEGKFFVWTMGEMEQVLGVEDARLLAQHFGATTAGNFEHGANVLEVAADVKALARELALPEAEVEGRIAQAKAKLLAHRERRVRPGRDDKVLAGWNGLAIRGVAFAARVFDRPEWVAMARRAADGLLRTHWRNGQLWRTGDEGAGIAGFLEDYGNLALGLIDLYQATFDAKYLEVARALAASAIELFWDGEHSAYRSARKDQSDLLLPPYSLHDNAVPSGASTLTEALVGLAALTGDPAHLDQAWRYLRKMRDEAMRNPFAYSHLLCAADSALDGAAEVTIVGDAGAPELLRVLRESFLPTLFVCLHSPGAQIGPILAPTLQGKVPRGKASAWVCRHFTCEAPIEEPSVLARALHRVGIEVQLAD